MFERYPFMFKLTFGLIFIIALIFSLIVARNFLYPIAMAILFAYLLYPISSRFEKIGIPRILANLISIIIGLVVIGGLFFLLFKQLSVFVDELPLIQNQAMRTLEDLEIAIEDKFGIPVEQQDRYYKEAILNFIRSSGGVLQDTLSATAGTIVKIGLMPVYVFFMLYYRNKAKKFILDLVPYDKHNKAETIIREISSVTKRYMFGIVLVILILCVLNSLGLLIIGLKYWLLLGILSALMNFIPYFGTLIGGAIPLAYTLITGSIQNALAVVILFLIIQFTENNILTPNITGGQVNINPFATILTIIIGGMIWGLPGMFVSVPFLGMFKIICDHFDQLQPLGFLLGSRGTEEHQLDYPKIKGFFKKLANKK